MASFGDSVELADELLDLVLHGPKRATAGLVADFTAEEEPLPRIGGHWVVCDGTGRATGGAAHGRPAGGRHRERRRRLRLGRGRGRPDPGRLAARPTAATGSGVCAARGDEFTEDQEVVFERFRVVWPPEHAD